MRATRHADLMQSVASGKAEINSGHGAKASQRRTIHKEHVAMQQKALLPVSVVPDIVFPEHNTALLESLQPFIKVEHCMGARRALISVILLPSWGV